MKKNRFISIILILSMMFSVIFLNTAISAEDSTQGGNPIELGAMLGDFFRMVADGIFGVEASPTGGIDGNSLKWTLLRTNPNYSDIDLRFGNDPSSVTDWTGAKELWFYLSNTEYGAIPVSIAFEEANPHSGTPESWNLIPGGVVRVHDGSKWTNVEVTESGCISVPANFGGWVSVPLNTETFKRYWAASEEGANDTIDLADVHQFQMHIEGSDDGVEKSVYMDSFAIVGDVNGETPPVADGVNGTFKVVWSVDNIIVPRSIISLSINHPNPPAAPDLKEPDGKRADSFLSNLDLSGFVGDIVKDNINEWQIEALKRNPNIIEQIFNGGITNTSMTLASMRTDPFSMLAKGVFEAEISATGGIAGNALRWTLLGEESSYRDIDLQFVNDNSAVTNWLGAEEFWFYFNNTEYGAIPVRVAFEEMNFSTNARESWDLIPGVTVRIHDGSQWANVEVTESGCIPVPENFAGWISIPLNTDTFKCYWVLFEEGANEKIDMEQVHQFQMHIEGADYGVGKSVYMDSIAIVGNVGGEAPPVADGVNGTFKIVWSFDNLAVYGAEEAAGASGSLVPWYNEFPGKHLTGMAYSYRLTKNADLLAAGEEIVAALKNAQGNDGYLGIYSGGDRMGGRGSNWDVWGHYHIAYGLYEWYKATGNTEALNIAINAVDYIHRYFVLSGRSFDSAGSQEMNLAISHIFAVMYMETEDLGYLDAAVQIVEDEWPLSGDWLNVAQSGKDFYQSDRPRWEALHTIITLGVLYEAEGNRIYYDALQDIWWSIAKTDRHTTGGFSTHEQAIGGAFEDGPIEFCCTVAWTALSTEYLQISQNSYVADELELSYFNGILGSYLDNNAHVTYNTPMDGVRNPSQEDIAFQSNEGSPEFNCCQANAARGVSQVAQWGFLTGDENLYINYYGPSAANTLTPGHKPITIVQETEYPKNGSVKITLKTDEKEKFKLNLRIPSWSFNTALTVNGEKMNNVVAGQYYVIDREWNNGDVLELTLEMSVHYWMGESLFEDKTAVYYGPVLMALDSSQTSAELGSVEFRTENLKNVIVSSGSGNWLNFDVTTVNHGSVKLIDFASAGQNRSSYISMLNVNHDMEYLPFVKGGNPVWNNSPDIPEYTITSVKTGEGIIVHENKVIFGNSTEVSITPAEGYSVSDVLINGTSVGSVQNYVLKNVRQNIDLEVLFSTGDGSAGGENEKDGKFSDLTWIIIISIVAVLLICGAAGFILIRRKKHRDTAN